MSEGPGSAKVAAMTRRGLALFLPLLAGGCSIWALVNHDPDGLPCADTAPFCLDGYTCVKQSDGVRICRKAAVGEEGASCTDDEECKEGLVCRDFYEIGCEKDDGRDPNCLRAPKEGRRCRRECIPAQPADQQCPPGQRCFEGAPNDTTTGWCQVGTCELSSECGTNPANNLDNLCITPVNPPGPSGLCALGCDPLRCNPVSGCAGCIDGLRGCQPAGPLGPGVPFACLPDGDVPYGSPCAGLDCLPGSFCLSTGAGAYCAQLCRYPNGAPACEVGRCNQIDGNVGYCG